MSKFTFKKSFWATVMAIVEIHKPVSPKDRRWTQVLEDNILHHLSSYFQ